MRGIIITLITASIGSLGFSLVFGLKKKHLLLATVGGFISWGIYLLLMFLIGGNHIFICCFFATVVGALYSDIIAHKVKAPALLFLLPMVIPLIPGSALYYTFLNFYLRNWNEAFNFGGKTLSFAFAIAAGLGAAWEIKKIKTNSKKEV